MRTNGHGKPIVALDIDGTLGDYHGHWMHFAELYFGKRFPHPSDINPGLRLWEFMGISQRDYRDAKLAYRQGGWKRWMPAYENAGEVTSTLRRIGAEVWICTTRPYLRLDNVDPDTRHWMSRNGIEYDAILFDDVNEKYSKYKELNRQAGDRVVAIADDLPELIHPAIELFPGATIIVRDQPYNKQVSTYIPTTRTLVDPAPDRSMPVRADNSGQILMHAAEAVVDWMERHERKDEG